jgi:hypothetical protein
LQGPPGLAPKMARHFSLQNWGLSKLSPHSSVLPTVFPVWHHDFL